MAEVTPASWQNAIEPEALVVSTSSMADKALLSCAISAKRQADALERIMKTVETMAGEMAHPEYGIAPTLREIQRNR
jgi:hypothetical protein